MSSPWTLTDLSPDCDRDQTLLGGTQQSAHNGLTIVAFDQSCSQGIQVYSVRMHYSYKKNSFHYHSWAHSTLY